MREGSSREEEKLVHYGIPYGNDLDAVNTVHPTYTVVPTQNIQLPYSPHFGPMVPAQAADTQPKTWPAKHSPTYKPYDKMPRIRLMSRTYTNNRSARRRPIICTDKLADSSHVLERFLSAHTTTAQTRGWASPLAMLSTIVKNPINSPIWRTHDQPSISQLRTPAGIRRQGDATTIGFWLHRPAWTYYGNDQWCSWRPLDTRTRAD